MASLRSNLPQLRLKLENLGRTLDLRHGRLGERICDLAGERIRSRTLQEQTSPDGSPLAPLAESTLRAKARKGQPATIGVATGEMLSPAEAHGRRAISEHELTFRYGVTGAAIEKAGRFETGRPGVQPPRPFVGLDESDSQAIHQLIEEHLQDVLKES